MSEMNNNNNDNPVKDEVAYTAMGTALVDPEKPATAITKNMSKHEIECVAPSDLPGDYILHVDYNGGYVVVRVPSGGVKQGERFMGQVLTDMDGADPSNGHDIPVGSWRFQWYECFANGPFHPTVWLSCFCGPIALGQVMTRMRLTPFGDPMHNNYSPYWSAFKVLLVSAVFCMCLDQFVTALINPYYHYVYDGAGNLVAMELPVWASILNAFRQAVQFGFFVYVLVVTIKTRRHIRDKYAIRGDGCEDCCLSFWCQCCTISQMAHHTANFDKWSAACCSETGLSDAAPAVV